ncbi:MAG: isoprenylcysteine carboxylmethyltransferase family protein [Caulobacteraceae bacterium]|nr:MAG: isoprenylcysteine carboxylmethyltransferase family protein [Caulobacteraceae bacterium]
MTVGVESLNSTQLLRKGVLTVLVLTALACLSLVSTIPTWAVTHEIVESIGLALMAVCIVGRCWCTLYIGGRKGAELVDVGPYSISRNPLYVFSFIGAAGMGAQTGSMLLSIGCALLCWAVFRATVAKEEAYLRQALGESYLRYMATTPRFLPNPKLWRGAEVLQVRPDRVALTFFDGLVFLLAIPAAEGLEWLQQTGRLPIILHLP